MPLITHRTRKCSINLPYSSLPADMAVCGAMGSYGPRKMEIAKWARLTHLFRKGQPVPICWARRYLYVQLHHYPPIIPRK